MKKFYLLLLFLSMGLSSVFAEEVTYTDGNGAVWTFEVNYQVWNGSGYDNHSAGLLKSVTNYGDDITVPSSVNFNDVDYSVDAIGDNVFKDNKSVTRIILPSTIKRINSYAFSGCSSLQEIGDLSHCEYIGSSAFYQCSSLKQVDLSACIDIQGHAFNGCQSLHDIESIANVTSVGLYAFWGCSSLKQVDLSASTNIGNSAFYNCSSLQNIGSLANATIGPFAFENCTSLKNVDLSSAITIGQSAFWGCSALESVGDLSSITSIDGNVFYGCSALEAVDLSACITIGEQAFYNCEKLTEANLAVCQTIGASAFNGCKNLETVNLNSCTTIGNSAFNGCKKLENIIMASTSIQSIGSEVFNYAGTLTLMSTTPPALGCIGDNILVKVPAEALTAYQSADVWKDIAIRIFSIGDTFNYTIEASAKESSSTIHELIGENNLGKVTDLTVSGTINSYDIMIIRNKMPFLHHLDLTNARIVDCSYEYYTGYHSENDVIGTSSFTNLTKLLSIKLPNTIKRIGNGAFSECSNLKSVTMYEGIENISGGAFSYCTQLKSITLPSGLITIEGSAFNYCVALENVDFPSTLESLGPSAFSSCNSLRAISLPVSLKTINSYAFSGCSNLQEVKIPSSVTNIYDGAFRGCSNLTKVYTYTIEPTSIMQTTFSNYATADLYVPTTSYNNYYWDTEWSQFRNLIEFDEPYTYFYINKDYVLDNGRIDGTPDADVNPGGSLTVEGDADQNIDDLNVISDENGTSGSVIADDNINANWLKFEIEVNANKWYFFAFPFNIKLTNIELQTKQEDPGEFVFRYYDGAERANNGHGGWKNLPVVTEELQKGIGYIFQCNKKGTLILKVQNPSFKAEDQSLSLTAHDATHAQDAGWNFIGNPYISYYDMNKTEYTAPITIWNGYSYEAIRPGDDDHHFHPFEAFFVQKPENVSEIVFDKDDRTTYIKSQQGNVAAARGMTRTVDNSRQRIELTIGDVEVRDKTRIVFNQDASVGYEISCDAAKFLSTENVPQIYSLDNESKYAINERPAGDVKLGYVAKSAGTFKIGAKRMDTVVMLYDQVTDKTVDLTTGDYAFETEAGTFENRFVVKAGVGGGTNTNTGGTGNSEDQTTGIASVKLQTGVSLMSDAAGIYLNGVGDAEVYIYTLSGTMLAKNVQDGIVPLPKATYIVKVNKLATKLMVK